MCGHSDNTYRVYAVARRWRQAAPPVFSVGGKLHAGGIAAAFLEGDMRAGRGQGLLIEGGVGRKLGMFGSSLIFMMSLARE